MIDLESQLLYSLRPSSSELRVINRVYRGSEHRCEEQCNRIAIATGDTVRTLLRIIRLKTVSMIIVINVSDY